MFHHPINQERLAEVAKRGLDSGAHLNFAAGMCVDRLAAKLAANTVRTPSGCLLWTGFIQPNGYGWINGRPKIAAHRAALIVAGRPVPAGIGCLSHL